MFFVKKEHEVEDLLFQHFQLVGTTLEQFQKVVEDYLKSEEDFKREAHKVHEFEHEADIVRREIGRKLYQGAFLPIYREDYLALVAMVDEVANQAETAISLIVLTRPKIPTFLQDDIMELAKGSAKTFEPLREALAYLSGDITKVMEVTDRIGKLEQTVDNIEWEATKKVYKSDLPLAEKSELRELINSIAKVSDLTEDAAERLDVMVVKRRY